jgi:hypothetical protein
MSRMRAVVATALITGAVLVAMPTLGEAAVTQTFSTAQSPFPPDASGDAAPNQGIYLNNYAFGLYFRRGTYDVARGRTGQDNYFTFDVRSACEATAVTLQVVRGSGTPEDPSTTYYGAPSYTIHEVTTPAATVNTPGGSPWDYDTFFSRAAGIFHDLEDGASYGEFPYPEDGSPSDVLSFQLSQAGVGDVNAARGGFFTLGGSGGGRSWVGGNQAIYRDYIFSGATDPGKLVVTCAVPTLKAQCKAGGWSRYGFRDRFDCVEYLEHEAHNACLFEKVAGGVAAFRAKYGRPSDRTNAMTRCIRRRIGS